MSSGFLTRRIGKRYKGGGDVDLSLEPPFPKNMMVELSNACNHKCVFCANPKMTRPIGRIDDGLLFRLMEQGYELGAREIGFYTTGDPLIHKGLARFVSQAKSMGYEYTYISTNGALATDDRIREVVSAGLDSIKFSINAGDRQTYLQVHGRDDWDIVLQNVMFASRLRKSLDRPLKLAITSVVFDQNEHSFEGFQERFRGHVDDIFLIGCGNQGGNMNENAQLMQSDIDAMPIKAPCRMLFDRAHITCEGYLTLCCVDYQNYLAVCDLNAVSLQEAWHDPLLREMRRRHLADELEGTLCENCIRNVDLPIAPLRPDLATPVDFGQLSKDNHERYHDRFLQITS